MMFTNPAEDFVDVGVFGDVVIICDLLFEFLAIVEFRLVFVWLVLWEHNNYKKR